MATATWLLLMLATAVGWWCGDTAQGAGGYVALATAGVIAAAFFKVWLVGLQFMELQQAPRALRYAFELWIIAITTALLVICLR